MLSEFHYRVVQASRATNHVNWPGAIPVTVVADSRDASRLEVKRIMGDPDPFCDWALRLDKVIPAYTTTPTETKEQK